MLNKWIPLSLRRAETSGIKLRVKYPRCSHRSHCARHSRVSRNFQSNVWNARGHLHRMPRRGNNAWPQGSKGILSRVSSSSFPFPPPLTATVVAGRGGGGVSARRAFLKAPSYPWHTNNGCGIKGPPGSRIRLSYTQCRHIWFTSLLAFLDSFPRQPPGI